MKGYSLAKFCKYFMIGLVVLNCYAAKAQEPIAIHQMDSLPKFDHYLFSYIIDFKDIVLLPTKWQTDDWTLAAFSATSMGVLYMNDQELNDWVQTSHSKFGNDVAKYVIEPWGSGLYSIPLLAAMYGYGKFSNNNRPAWVALQGAKAVVLASFITGGLKMAFHRHRPNESNNPYQYDGIAFSFDHLSLPSGHTALAFALATTLSCNYRDKPWVTVVAYSLATTVGLSRIYQKQHWASDVLAGALIGYVVGKSIFRGSEWEKSQRLRLQPFAGGNGGGIRLSYRF